MRVEISGVAGEGKTTISREIAVFLKRLGFDVTYQDTDEETSFLVHEGKLAALKETFERNETTITICTQLAMKPGKILGRFGN